MKLKDIFDGLSGVEFSQISIGGQPAGVINENNYTQVVNQINLGMTALFRRFHLKEGTLKLALQKGQSIYPLKDEFAVTSVRSTQPVRFIEDTVATPFLDDVMQITQVLTEFNVPLKLNDVADPLSCMTPNMKTLVVPNTLANPSGDTPYWLRVDSLQVRYRAAAVPIKVPLGYFDPARVDVELPNTHLEALLYFVASRVNNPIGMGQEFNAGNNYAAKYEAACRELVNEGMEVSTVSTNTRLHQKGFV